MEIDWPALRALATQTAEQAYAPYSKLQVGAAAQFLRSHRDSGAVEPADLLVDAEDLSAVLCGPVQHRLHHQTFGPVLVGLVGAGLLIFAVFSLFEARYRRL